MMVLTIAACIVSLILTIVSVIGITDLIYSKLNQLQRDQTYVFIMQLFISTIVTGATIVLLTGITIRPSLTSTDDTQKPISYEQKDKS